MRGALFDYPDLLRSAIGRPRVACGVGDAEGLEHAEQQGAKVLRDDAETHQKADLVVVGADSSGGDLPALLRRLAPRVADGGHVVVAHRPPTNGVVPSLREAGFEPLWHARASRSSHPDLTVARLAPKRGPLTLTVGMISMNEAAAVGGVIDLIREHCPDAQILLVDSSKDETPAIAEKRGAHVIRQFPPRGYGPAMTRLLYSATTDVIVTMDCDGTYPANRIRTLHELVERGADLANASRTHHRPKAMPLPNYVANRTFATVAGLVHGFWTTDLHSGMRAYRTSMLRGIYVPEKGLALPVELLLLPARHGYRVEDVNIDYFDRIGETTLNRWDSTVGTFRRIAHVVRTGGSPIR